jgi:hypothetical protein
MLTAGEAPGGRAAPDYMRYAEDASSARLEVAIKSFRMPGGQVVDLIGVVHIADDAYYQRLNRRFDRYDSVLFELVGDPQRLTHTPPQVLKQEYDRQYASVISMSALQIAVGKYLNLTFQLGEIDYTKANMVHADVSTAEFARMQEERGETMLTLLMRAMNAQFSGTADTTALNDLDMFTLIRILLSPDAATEFKKTLARMFDQGEALTQLIEGDEGSAVLSGRNEVVVRKIREILADRGQRRVAVLYGAGHMPGIETTLIDKLNARPAREEWLAAWTMPK